jgi:hypothetical protein
MQLPQRPVKQTGASILALIEETLRDEALSAVAEEYNLELLKAHNNAESILRSITMSVERESGRRIEHIFAEPCGDEKRTIGYKEDSAVKEILKRNSGLDPPPELVWAHMAAHQFPIREEFWLEKIKAYLDGDILFVCGDAPIDTFPLLLDSNGSAYKVPNVASDLTAKG